MKKGDEVEFKLELKGKALSSHEIIFQEPADATAMGIVDCRRYPLNYATVTVTKRSDDPANDLPGRIRVNYDTRRAYVKDSSNNWHLLNSAPINVPMILCDEEMKMEGTERRGCIAYSDAYEYERRKLDE